MLKIVETSTRGTNSMPFLVLRRGSFEVHIGIICGSGSFAVQFGDHLRSGDHLRLGIICGAVHMASWIHRYFDNVMTKFMIITGQTYTKTDANLLNRVHCLCELKTKLK